jgi:hypothetical protein
MKRFVCGLSLIVSIAFICTVPSQAAEEVSIMKDLTSVIALLGLPCGKVISVVRKGENDHIATCENGNRYRVYLNNDGRVVAEKL